MAEENNLFDPELAPKDTRPEEHVAYNEEDIVSLPWNEQIRLRPGMYVSGTGDGSEPDDGLYVLIKEIIDNSIDEFRMGYGRQIDVNVTQTTVSVRDFGRGIPLEKVVDSVSEMFTSGKYRGDAFKKSVGLNGVGAKAVNALSADFEIRSYRDGKMMMARFSKGLEIMRSDIVPTDEPNGTFVQFTPDNEIFRNYQFHEEFVVPLVRNFTFLNTGLAIVLNGKRYFSRNGLLDLLKENMDKEPLYPIIHLKGEDIEIALTHARQYGEEFYSFVNGANMVQGGTHLDAFKLAVTRTIKEFLGKNYEPSDIRGGMVAAVAVNIQDPEFESQTKVKLKSRTIEKDGITVAKFVGDFVKTELDNYLHRHKEDAEIIQKIVQENEKDRKATEGVSKLARERAKKVSLNNKKLLDCTVHYNDTKGKDELKAASSIFITEGLSASGSISKIRDVATQAVFSLRGKPLNSYGLTRKVVYENEEFNLLQAALNIENGLDGLRYNKVIIATDADVDGMHIRLLLLTFFLQFFPELVKKGHVYVLQTPLFRVRNKKTSKRKGGSSKESHDEIYYCYSDQERITAIERLGTNAEITRFKGLGEISPDEFKAFIGPDMRLDRVSLTKEDMPAALMEFYMGNNTPQRREFIIDNLIYEDDSEIS